MLRSTHLSNTIQWISKLPHVYQSLPISGCNRYRIVNKSYNNSYYRCFTAQSTATKDSLPYQSELTTSTWQHSLSLLNQYHRIQNELDNNITGLSQQQIKTNSMTIKQLHHKVQLIQHIQQLRHELVDIIQIINESIQLQSTDNNMSSNNHNNSNTSNELYDLAIIERDNLLAQLRTSESELIELLLPGNVDDNKNAIIEIRAGIGGDEAALFAAELFQMYKFFAQRNEWKFDTISYSDSTLGGIKEGSASITGNNVFGKLKFESGVHRVQRIPQTESSGRLHTSAATVAILPEAEDIDINISDKDIRIDVMRASGAGGQHVNKVESAVRFTHIPTNIIVNMQDERSQQQNRVKAMKVLRSRVYQHYQSQYQSSIDEIRRSQIGTGDRSERIRTYNYPSNRITDHRCNTNIFGIDKMLAGELLDELIIDLRHHNKIEQLELIAQQDKQQQAISNRPSRRQKNNA